MTNPSEDPPTRGSGGFAKFWTSLPGVLTGIAAVVAAVVSLIAVFHHQPDVTSTPAATAVPPAAQVTTSAPATPVPSTTALTTPPGSPSTGGVGTGGASADTLVRGSLTMGVDEHADLVDQVVSDSGSANQHDPQFFLSHTDGYRLVTDSALALALVDGSADRATCLARVSSRQLGQLELSAAVHGKTICVLTGDQQIAALSPTSLPVTGSPVFKFDYVLWG